MTATLPAMADEQVTIRIRTDGPYVVTGPFRLTDAAGTELDVSGGANVALCRCGHSITRPFCDGTHRTIGFDGSLAPQGPAG